LGFLSIFASVWRNFRDSTDFRRKKEARGCSPKQHRTFGVGPLAGIPKTPIILEFGQVARGDGALSKLPRAHCIGPEI